MQLLMMTLAFLASAASFAGGTVTHQNHCPGYYRSLDLCLNYDFPKDVRIGEEEVPFTIEFYEGAAADAGERVYVEIEGELSATLMMAHDSGDHSMEMPVKLIRTAAGKYEVRGAAFVMPGLWTLQVDIVRPQELIKRTHLFVYIYPDRT